MVPSSSNFNIDFTGLDYNSPEYANILRYPYRMLKSYLKTPKSSPIYDHQQANLRGEMYENLIYERLMSWANSQSRVTEFILKGPYVHAVSKQDKHLIYNSRNQIFCMSSGETIAEFDAMLSFAGCRYLVEISNTDNKPLIKQLKYELHRKANLMRILFPGEELGYWIITTYRNGMDFKGLPNVVITKTPKYNLNPSLLCEAGKPGRLIPPPSSKFKTVYQLHHQSFDYLAVMSSLQSEIQRMHPSAAKGKLLELITPYIGLIERVFLGELSVQDLAPLLQQNSQQSLVSTLDIDRIILALKIKTPPTVNVVAYIVSKRKLFYEIDLAKSTVKTIESRKRATRDIRYFGKAIKYIS